MSTPKPPEPAGDFSLLSADDAATLLKMSRATLLRLVRDRKVPFVKIGGCPTQFTPAHIEEIISLFENRPES